MGVVIHAGRAVGWQMPMALRFLRGLEAIGIPATISDSRDRVSDVAILLGTSLWRNIEVSGKYLLVDRASFGDPFYVQLVWNGHGRRGNHCVPDDLGDRWERMGVKVKPWRTGSRVILCGQTETYSPHWADLVPWYRSTNATHFRPHPRGMNYSLPLVKTFDDCKVAITLNSSVGVDAVMSGVPTVTMDEGAMAWDVTGHRPDEIVTPDRTDWLRWLAWTQWNEDEIVTGHPIKHLFEGL